MIKWEFVVEWRSINWGGKANLALSAQPVPWAPGVHAHHWAARMANDCWATSKWMHCPFSSEALSMAVWDCIPVGAGKEFDIHICNRFRQEFCFWLPMYYENELTIIIVPLKNLGQQLTDKSSQWGLRAMSMTTEILGESPNLLKVRHALSDWCQKLTTL